MIVDLEQAHTVAWYRHSAKRLGKRSWRGAAQAAARRDGRALVLHGDDRLTIMEMGPRGVRATTLAPEQWRVA